MRIYFDCEFTGLHQKTTLISIAFISEDGRTFYSELNDYDTAQVDDWLRENVMAHLRFGQYESLPKLDLEHHAMKGSRSQVAFTLAQWLAQWESVELWGDVLAYDWVLFCQLWGGGAECLPRNVYYIPFDLTTALKLCDVDPDINRIAYANLHPNADPKTLPRHNALFDAKVVRGCFRMLQQDYPDVMVK